MVKGNIVDRFVDLFRKFKIWNPFIKIYDKYKEKILYLIFGGLTTLINIIIYVLFAKLSKVGYMVSNCIAWILAVVFAYITNKLFVFESKNNTKTELLIEILFFVAARILSLLLDIFIMYWGISVLKLNDIFIKIISNILVVIANYIMSKLFIFNRK